MKVILHLCADIGSDSKPYADNGYNVILVGKDIGVENFQPPKNVYGVIANPVCTEFSTARTGGISLGGLVVHGLSKLLYGESSTFQSENFIIGMMFQKMISCMYV